jgi:hypothetical protein
MRKGPPLRIFSAHGLWFLYEKYGYAVPLSRDLEGHK